MTNYLLAMAIFAAFYALMALGLNVIWGLAGMVNLGLVGFFAVGAYVSALLTLKLGLPIVVGVGEELAGLLLDPSYRTAVGFAAILVTLSFRPRGLLGERAY